jgi:hypothetical protein
MENDHQHFNEENAIYTITAFARRINRGWVSRMSIGLEED